MARVGPRRANRSFNDELIVIHPLHDDFRDEPKIAGTNRVRTRCRLQMTAAEHQGLPVLLRLGHGEKNTAGRHDLRSNDWVRRQIIEEVEFDVL